MTGPSGCLLIVKVTFKEVPTRQLKITFVNFNQHILILQFIKCRNHYGHGLYFFLPFSLELHSVFLMKPSLFLCRITLGIA